MWHSEEVCGEEVHGTAMEMEVHPYTDGSISAVDDRPQADVDSRVQRPLAVSSALSEYRYAMIHSSTTLIRR